MPTRSSTRPEDSAPASSLPPRRGEPRRPEALPRPPDRPADERRRAERRQPGRGGRTTARPSPLDAALQEQWLARQLRALHRQLPAAVAASLVITLLLAAFGAPGGDAGFVWVWALLVVAMQLGMLQLWWSQRDNPATPGPRVREHIAVAAATFAFTWGLAPGWLLGLSQGNHTALLSSALLSLGCIGGVVLAALPMAAYAHLGGLSAALLLGHLLQPAAELGAGLALALLWSGCVAVLVSAVRWSDRSLEARVRAEHKVGQQEQLIRLLLRDFGEQGGDLLWEIDAAGRMSRVTRRLAAAFGRPPADLERRPLLAVLTELQAGLSDADREAARLLQQCLTEGRPFRDVLLPIQVRGQTCWWSLTAKPLSTEDGAALGWRGVARDVTQARLADRRLSWLAHSDTLTGLSNRAHFRVLLEQTLKQAELNQSAGAVFCLDLDNFKNVNDTLGHPAGDALLVEVGRRIQAAVAREDVVARLGGDEYAVLVRGEGRAEALAALAQRILDALQPPCAVLGAQIAMRLSIGIARYPSDGRSVDELLQRADLALYDAKSQAPGQARFYAQRMGEQVRRRQVLERDLREAIETGQLSLDFQPKVELRGWTITGFEALLRWRHPEHGNIPPNEFIPVAEDSGLILPLGAWALQEACRQAVQWPGALQVAVNLSPAQLMDQQLATHVATALSASGLAAGRLELEITESALLQESRGPLQQLQALHRLGVQVALDDFGTGYSALAYLRRFPFDTLKIDRAFVRELLVSRETRAIVRNLLALARSLGMVTVAEGVEEPAQAIVLADEGCERLQGYLAARPMPADEVRPFLRRWDPRQRPALPAGPGPVLATTTAGDDGEDGKPPGRVLASAA